MNQNNATPDELQQAINSITNPSGAAADAASVAAAYAAPEAVSTPEAAAPVAETPVASYDAPAETAAVEPAETAVEEPAAATYGDSDLGKVKTMALGDLRPILDNVDLPAEKKFKIYKDIIEATNDKACIEPAYNAAKMIADEKEKAEALLYIIEAVDKFGVAA